jgi:stage IV sporulation protein FB
LAVFLLAGIMLALNYLGQFCMLLLAVTLHELSHIAAAKAFGLSADKMLITPIGEIAVINRLETLPLWQKITVLAAGPLMNLLLFFAVPGQYNAFKAINLSLTVFNLLPVYPLDGGRMLQFLFARGLGVLPSNQLMMRLGVFFSRALIFLGFVQAVFFPYNLSLIFTGLYLKHTAEKAYMQMAFDFYKTITAKTSAEANCGHGQAHARTRNRFLPVKAVVIGRKTKIKPLLYKLNWDHYYLFHMLYEGALEKVITEQELIRHVLENGLGGGADEI